MKTVVQINGYDRRRLDPIAFVNLIREYTGVDLRTAKDQVDALREGNAFELRFQDQESADRFLKQAIALGAVVSEVL